MGQLTLAKTIADKPSAYSLGQMREAYAYLDKTRLNGGVRSSERAWNRLEKRLDCLRTEIHRRIEAGC
jgi:hypothetical protein